VRRLIVEDLTIRAGDRTLVDEVSFALEEGKILAIVGPSGAGKTVMTRSLLGLRGPQPGVVGGAVIVEEPDVTARLYDSQEAKDALAIFSRLRGDVIGYLPQQARDSLDPLWTVGKQVQEAMDLAGHSDRVEDWLRRAGFQHPDQVMALYPHELSGGMAQRVCIALAIARGSRFLLADEPTTGLDPQSRRKIWDILKRFRADGHTILLTTHYMDEAERLCDRVAVVDQGKVIALGSPNDLIASLRGEHMIEFSVANGVSSNSAPVSESELRDLPGVSAVRIDGTDITLTASEPHVVLPPLLQRLGKHSEELTRLSIRHASLEDVFVELTGRHLRDGDAAS